MRIIALRFSNNFAPEEGTICAHDSIISKIGYVWYGKLGCRISQKVINEIMCNDNPRILLIHSGGPNRYWAYVEQIINDEPPYNEIPEYYRDRASEFKSWFKVTRFETAPRNVLSKCFVVSSGAPLSVASKHSMSPYFIVEYEDN